LQCQHLPVFAFGTIHKIIEHQRRKKNNPKKQ